MHFLHLLIYRLGRTFCLLENSYLEITMPAITYITKCVEYIRSFSNEGAENNLFLVNEVPMTLSTSLTKQIHFIEIPPTHIW